MAPEDTRITSWPRLRRCAMSAAKLSSQARLRRPFLGVHQQRGPDFDDHAFRFGQAASAEFTVGDIHEIRNIAIYLAERPPLIFA